MTWTRLLRHKVVKACLGSDYIGLLKLIFLSPTRQRSPQKLFMLSRRSGNCSLNMEWTILFCRLCVVQYKQTI